MHPVQRVVESLYAAGRCPRLHVNAEIEGVVCPDDVRTRWGERLILDLDETYPLDLSYDDEGLSADLSFGGVVTRCTFPWEAVYVVADRATGRGIVLESNMPDSVKRASTAPTTAPLPEQDDLRSVFGEAEAFGDASGAGDEDDDPEHPDPDSDAPLPDKDEVEEEAQARRAAFKVIDGGG
jgi:stringent starvation protein B